MTGSAEHPIVLVADRGRSLVPADQTILAREAVGLVPVPTGESLLEALRRQQPRLLIVGPDLPDTPIVDLCRRIRNDPTVRRVSILLVASPSERKRADEIHAAGANDVIFRPLDPAEFDAKVASLLSVPVRKELRVLVQVKIDASREGFFFLGHTRNLSISGALLEVDHPLETGSKLGIRFFLPGRTREIIGAAEIVRERPAPFGQRHYGIRFVGLTDDDRRAIGSFIERKSVAELLRERDAGESVVSGGGDS